MKSRGSPETTEGLGKVEKVSNTHKHTHAHTSHTDTRVRAYKKYLIHAQTAFTHTSHSLPSHTHRT